MGIDRQLLRASLARSPRERFERAVQLARFNPLPTRASASWRGASTGYDAAGRMV
jgi:hypothetical protein